jgi:predicted nucleic acid-binding Zn ribbon protein
VEHSKLFCICDKISDEEQHQNHKNTQCQLLIEKKQQKLHRGSMWFFLINASFCL